jgi:predicted  nucleic acid-binding Zn-ribbon protein
MTNTTMGALHEIQKLDDRIRELEEGVRAFDPRLAEVEEPALELEGELGRIEERLAQMESDARRLERSADDRRARASRLDERLEKVQNLREEAAVRTELDLINRAIEADEHEALQLMDRIRRAEIARDEVREAAELARSQVGPEQESLLAERSELERELDVLRGKREGLLEAVTGAERRVYESFHASGRSVVVAPLLEDGACGHCFGMVPLQVQNEIRHTEHLIRCEACGVILTAGDGGGDEPGGGDAGEG